MEIHLTTKVEPLAAPQSAASARSRLSGDAVAISDSVALEHALAADPETRSEAVARGEVVLGDVQYPPADIIERLSRLLAENWPPS